MKKKLIILIFTVLFSNAFSQSLHHKLNIELLPDKGLITVIDTIYLQKNFCEGSKIFYFELNKELNVKPLSDKFTLSKVPAPTDPSDEIYSIKYKIEFPEPAKSD